jgi:hypothetical protein
MNFYDEKLKESDYKNIITNPVYTEFEFTVPFYFISQKIDIINNGNYIL